MKKTAAYMTADLNRLDRETGMLLATVDSLSEEELGAASLCEGWTRAHVVAQLIDNAEGLGNLVTWAVTGTETRPSEEARNAQIEELARQSPAELKRKLRSASEQFAATADQLRSAQLATEEVNQDVRTINAYAIPSYRISEVLIHHADLDTVWELEEADIDALEDALDLAVDRLQKRDDWPGLQIETDGARATRSVTAAPPLSKAAAMPFSAG